MPRCLLRSTDKLTCCEMMLTRNAYNEVHMHSQHILILASYGMLQGPSAIRTGFFLRHLEL